MPVLDGLMIVCYGRDINLLLWLLPNWVVRGHAQHLRCQKKYYVCIYPLLQTTTLKQISIYETSGHPVSAHHQPDLPLGEQDYPPPLATGSIRSAAIWFGINL